MKRLLPDTFKTTQKEHAYVSETHHHSILYELYRRLLPEHSFQEYSNYRASFTDLDDMFSDLLDRIQPLEACDPRPVNPVFEQMTLFELGSMAIRVNAANGWYDGVADDQPSTIEEIAMVINELSEGVQELQRGRKVYEEYYKYPNGAWGYEKTREIDGVIINGAPSGFGIEMADALIRLLTLARRLDIPLDRLAVRKIEYNATRGYRHGGKLL